MSESDHRKEKHEHSQRGKKPDPSEIDPDENTPPAVAAIQVNRLGSDDLIV